ncbi:hypothetical protein [Magnetococcus sp. PR-3]|uniref:hypothetical protein n=1 Tax=Magnetococcus sp. PR-3 TaxID=3120355 RepID=UPI002FCE095A
MHQQLDIQAKLHEQTVGAVICPACASARKNGFLSMRLDRHGKAYGNCVGEFSGDVCRYHIRGGDYWRHPSRMPGYKTVEEMRELQAKQRASRADPVRTESVRTEEPPTPPVEQPVNEGVGGFDGFGW